MITLSKRLSVIASLINKGECVADIGTDHAYLPIYLLQNGISPRAVASDLREKPLASARANAELYGVTGLSLKLGDGLKTISEDDADVLILAGMGGECIAKILSECPWVKNSGKRIIAQPMTSPEEIRKYFCENGYSVLSEQAVFDEGRIYTVIEASADGNGGKTDEAFIFTGLLNPQKKYDRLFLTKQYERLQGAADALKKTDCREQFEMFSRYAKYIKDYIEV